MGLLAEQTNDFGNGTSNYWNISQIVLNKNDGYTLHIAHYFSEDALKLNDGNAVSTFNITYTQQEFRDFDPDGLNGELLEDLWDLSVHTAYEVIKAEIAIAVAKEIAEEELTGREQKLIVLKDYQDVL